MFRYSSKGVHKQAVPFLTWKVHKAKITCVRCEFCFTNLTSLKSNESVPQAILHTPNNSQVIFRWF